MLKKNVISLFIVLVLFLLNNAYAGGYVWVSSMNAKLKKERGAASHTLKKLPRHTRLAVKSYVKRWYFVETNAGEKGWIYRGKVTDIPPEQEIKKPDSSGNNLFGNIFGDTMESDIASDTNHSDRSIRGLSAENRYERKKGISKDGKDYAQMSAVDQKYQKALDTLLQIKVTDSELDYFLKQGKIGEYSE
jgi:hypothetical protein